MNKTNILDITNMIMVYDDDGNILVQDRKKKDWPGINFPGGHVEPNETILQSAKRELLEETGLIVEEKDLEECGYYEWNDYNKGIRYIAFLFRTNKYRGQLSKSDEGVVKWVNPDCLSKYQLSVDFEKLYIKMKK